MSELEPPPSLVKCLGATVAGSIFALLGMMMENFRSRKNRSKESISREELGNLIPKRPRSLTESSSKSQASSSSGTLRQRHGMGKTPSAPGQRSGASSPADGESPSRTPLARLAPPSLAQGGRELSEVEKAERQVKSCLNKITRETFNKLYDQIRECCISSCSNDADRAELVEVVARETFAKAVKQHGFVELYADLCARLHADFEKGGITVNFKRVLLDQCQQSFKRYLEPPKIDQLLDYEEQYEQLVKYKTQMLGNVKLIGHLLRRAMLSPKIIFHCTDELLSINTDESLETLCVFLDTIGTTFDSSDWQGRPRLEEVFTRVELLVEDNRQSSRIRCLLKDLLDKRRSSWRDLSGRQKRVM